MSMDRSVIKDFTFAPLEDATRVMRLLIAATSSHDYQRLIRRSHQVGAQWPM